MNGFEYTRAVDIVDAVRQIAADPAAKFIAGGTNLIDLMKENVARPSRLIDITRLPLDKIEETTVGGLRIGALVPNSDLAYHPRIEARYPVLSSAILAGASQQLRNMASTGGNLLQRTRCLYFYDTSTPCNKREPGSGCSAIGGINRMHAILGTSEHCIATHPSDMCVALAALDARVLVTGTRGQRSIAFDEFHRLPDDTPQIDTSLRADEIITAIELPPKGFAENYTYLKIRDRLSYAFALVSVAVGLDIEGDRIKDESLALGGVAHKPWRDREPKRSSAGHRRPAKASRRRPKRCCGMHAASATTTSRSNWRVGPFCVRWARRRAGRHNRRRTSASSKPVECYDPHQFSRQTDFPCRRTCEGYRRCEIRGRIQRAWLTHGVVVSSTIARGRIKRIDVADALAVQGVLDVFTHDHRPNLASSHENIRTT